VEKHGWEAFRAEEEAAIRTLLQDTTYSADHVIACGGGVIETGVGNFCSRFSSFYIIL
jgi:shikimate kinase